MTLTLTSEAGSIGCVKALVAAGANVNVRSNSGWTALMQAAAYYPEIVPVLKAARGKMKIQQCFLVMILAVTFAQPIFAMCLGDYLAQHLSRPAVNPFPNDQSGDELALVKIAAVLPDAKPQAPWKETGTLELVKIETSGKHLPMRFSVHYQKRFNEGWDCETWDFVILKPDERLLGFFHPQNTQWSVPETAASNVINNVEDIDAPLLKRAQRLFHTRLLLPHMHGMVQLHF